MPLTDRFDAQGGRKERPKRQERGLFTDDSDVITPNGSGPKIDGKKKKEEVPPATMGIGADDRKGTLPKTLCQRPWNEKND